MRFGVSPFMPHGHGCPRLAYRSMPAWATSRMLDLRRRQFITLLASGAAAWPLAARAQQGERVRRIAVLSSLAADDPETQARHAAFLQGLQEWGWTSGRNVQIDYRWAAGDADRIRKYAAELVALAPDVIKTAKALGLEIPQTVLARADEVIE